jgi:hypothetical protein
LLARRVTDSHERKAAVELQALRDELAKLGFIRQEPLKEKTVTPASTGNKDFRAVRPMRVTRATRLSPVQRLARVVADVRRWCGLDQNEAVEVLAHGHQEPVKQTEKISPDLKQTPERTTRRSLRGQVRQSIEDYHKQQQRRSGGIRT